MNSIFATAHRQRRLVVSVCLALMFAQVSGVHFHLCLEALAWQPAPVAALHLEDGGHHEPGSVHGSNDLELKALADALAQPFGTALPMFLLLAFTLLPASVACRFLRRARATGPFRPPDPPRLRPPLRGPPTTLSLAR
jgi:hypothetical protein